MNRWLEVGILVLGGVALAGIAAVTTAALLWKRATARAVGPLTQAVLAQDANAQSATFSREQLASLPTS